MKKAPVLAIFVLIAAPLWAQQGRTGVEGLQFIAPLQATFGHDNHFLIDRTTPNEKLFVLSLPASVQPAAPATQPFVASDEFFTLTLPKIAYEKNSRRHQFRATYVPGFEVFARNPDQSSFDHEATVGFGYFLSRKFQILLGDSYKTSHDPARAKENVFLLLPRGPYRENAARGAIEYVPNLRTAVEFSYDTSWAKFGDTTDPFQTRFLNTRSSGYVLGVTRMLTRRQRLRGIYSIFRISPIRDTGAANDSVDVARSFLKPVHSAQLQYRIGVNRTTLLEFSGGVIGLNKGPTYTFSAALDKRLGYYWIGARFGRTLSFFSATPEGFPTGLGSNGFYDDIAIKFRGQPTLDTGFRIELSMSRSASEGALVFSKALMATARIDHRVTERSSVFASFETYQQNRNVFVQAPLERARFAVGVEYSFSSEAQRRYDAMNQDDTYVALTDHARRRGAASQGDK